MSSINLPVSQKAILTALVNLSTETDEVVNGEEIAKEVDRSPGTIRNQMQPLKALQLAEGVLGPRGGYKPTERAYEVLDVPKLEEEAEVPLFNNKELVKNSNVENITLTSVHHPNLCRAEIHVQGSVKSFHSNDIVRVGPTPLSNLIIEGPLESKDESNRILILNIQTVEAPTNESEH